VIDLLLRKREAIAAARVDASFGLLAELRASVEAEADLVMAAAVKNQYLARAIERTKQPLYAT